MEAFFNCKVASQYGCYEVNSIAYECPFHKLHVMTENVYVEIVEDNQICITSKHNRVMPFVRYKVGDRGRLCKIRIVLAEVRNRFWNWRWQEIMT